MSIMTCRGCGATKPGPDGTPTDCFPSEHCGQCPPWRCETCGDMCSASDLCGCWITFEGMAFADVKAHLAAAGFDVGVPS
ncbi:hypothetical protein [Embleya sp. NPDC005971]|uniref:hypothetical protein n=1 Tax=Embleya sp. NPDC005971 TaxID=3156724 RepID=UPI0033CCBFC4